MSGNYQTPSGVDWLTRLALLETNALSDSPIADQVILGSRFLISPLATPGAPSVTPTPTTGATTITYVIVALLGSGYTPASAASSTTIGPSTMSATATCLVGWTAVLGAAAYNVYRTVGGPSQGLIATVIGTSLLDTGLVGDGTTAPTLSTTGMSCGGAIQDTCTAYLVNGAIAAFGFAPITKAGVCALTIGQPKAGAPSVGGHDGLTITIVDTTGHAHTVTAGTNGFNGAHSVATFGGTVGQFGTLKAYNGTWYVTASSGFTLSA